MRKKRKYLFMVPLIVILFLSSTMYGFADEDEFEKIDFINRLVSLENEQDSRFYLEWQEDDMEYLKSDIKDEIIRQEIKVLDDKIYNKMKDYTKTKSGAILYDPHTSGLIHFLKTAKINRVEYLKDRAGFSYDTSTFYFPRKTVKGSYARTIPQERLDIIYEEIELMLDEIDEDLLDNLVVSIIPFQMEGMAAFTEVYGQGGQGITVVMSENNMHRNNIEGARLETRSTFLHELGHVLHYNRSLDEEDYKDKDAEFWKSYNSIYDNNLEFTFGDSRGGRSLKNWRNDCAESFAEDFRIYYSDKMGYIAREDNRKNMDIEYRQEVEDFIDENLRKVKRLEEPGIYKSRLVGKDSCLVKDSDFKKVSKREVETFEIEYDNKDLESYIEVWDRNQRRLDRIALDDGNCKKTISIKDNTGALIKYRKENGSFKCIWRIDLKD